MSVYAKNATATVVMAELCPKSTAVEPSNAVLIHQKFKNTDISSLSPEQMKNRAMKWYELQMLKAAIGQGKFWVKNKTWIEEYLKEEIRQRLLVRGWKAKK